MQLGRSAVLHLFKTKSFNFDCRKGYTREEGRRASGNCNTESSFKEGHSSALFLWLFCPTLLSFSAGTILSSRQDGSLYDHGCCRFNITNIHISIYRLAYDEMMRLCTRYLTCIENCLEKDHPRVLCT